MSADPRFTDQGFTDPRFDPGYNEPVEPKKRSPWTTCLIGCLVMCAILLLLAIAAALWVRTNWRGWTADFGSMAVDQAINASGLPAEEKAEVKVQVERVTTAFRDGRLSMEQLGMIMQQIADSPLLPSIMVMAIDRAYLAKSGLTDDEKAAGRITLQRLMRGFIDKQIDEQTMDSLMAHVADRKPDGNWQLRQRLSDEELRAFLDAAKTAADDAGVAAEPPEFDPSDEIKRIIDNALAETAVEAPVELPQPAEQVP
jgi:hypothetical protein